MPQLGETVAEGRITAWSKAVGDRIAAGEVLFEIETDKTAMEVPTTSGGIVSEIRVPAGATVPVGTVVAVLSAGPAAAANGAGANASGSAGTTAAPTDPYRSVRTPARNYGPATLPNGVKVTPAARRLAAESGVDLSTLRGSTRHGHITARDIEDALKNRAPAAAGAPPSHVSSAPPKAMPPPQAQAAAPLAESGRAEADSGLAERIRSLYAHVPHEVVPLDVMRRTIARRLVEAKQTIPHFYLNAEVQVDRLLQLRGEINDAGRDIKLSVNDWIIKAAAMALQRVPEANAAWAGDALLRFRHSDISVAVAVDGGLYTPVIRQAEAKTLAVLSKEMKELAARARSHALAPDDYRGGALTLSNLGMHGVRSFEAIVNPPQAAILAVGAAEKRAVEGPNGTVRFATVMALTLSCDHRIIDGALGARLLAALRTLLEAPASLLV